LTIGAFRPRGASTDDEEGAQKPNLVLIGAAVAATAVVGGAFWYFMPGSGFSTRGAAPAAATHAAPPAAAAAAATESPGGASAAASEALLVQGKVDDLLEKARLAMHERRYTEPAGDNALLYYRSTIAQDPHNGEALDGLSRVAGVLAGRVEDAIGSGHLDEAALTLASFKSAAPNDLRSGPLEQRLSSAQMSKALTDGNFERAAALLRQAQQSGSSAPDQIARWRSDLARRQEEARVQRLAGLIADRIRDGKLTDAEDSAKIYLQQLESSAASSASTHRAVHDLSAALPDLGRELAARLLERARAAVLAGKSADADLAQAKRWGADPKDVQAVQQLGAPVAKTTVDTASLASSLKRLRASPPDYPPS